MGSRLSRPKGPAGTTEASVPAKPGAASTFPRHRSINSRTIVVPAALALILFVYARTSIRAAKANAQRHRDADTGGEGLSLLAEHRRRHGMARKVEGDEGGTVRQLGRELLGKRREGNGGKERESADGEDEMSKLLKMKMREGRKDGSGSGDGKK